MHVLLVSTYDLGRQPFGLASPAAWLRRAGAEVVCVDTSRDRLDDSFIAAAELVAFYLPMHTATRLAAPLIARVQKVNPRARMAAYGLYAPINAGWLRGQGVQHVIGPEAEQELAELASGTGPASGSPAEQRAVSRLTFIPPDRSTLPALRRYASLQMPDGTRKVVGSTDATRGCKHLCRHCPIVPVYHGRFRAVPLDVVIEDVRTQVAGGAEHISFGDPDFLNGPTHARRLVERLAREFPHVTYDATIKIEHIVKHPDMLPRLRETGCLFITSAVESIDDDVLARLRKGHTCADFVRAVDLCRDAGVPLSPTFVPFTPWTTLEGYARLIRKIDALDLAGSVAPIQWGIRLLVTAESALLELADLRERLGGFDAGSLTWTWKHEDPRVDALQQEVVGIVTAMAKASRHEVFRAIASRGVRPGSDPGDGSTQGIDTGRVNVSVRDGGFAAGVSTGVHGSRAGGAGLTPPYLTEGWYCCAEPGPELLETV
jgi:radical SAM superfamily enzyme YgiQ (UPF0313 family)